MGNDLSNDLVIPRVTVLKGHTDPDTAYLVKNYPYGGGLHCQIRYWIDTRKHTGDQRFVSQTTNPRKAGIWNSPKPRTYSPITIMYLDGMRHVQSFGISFQPDGPTSVRVQAMGLYAGMTDVQRERYDALLVKSFTENPITWAEWEGKIAVLAEYIARTGNNPTLVNQVWTDGDRQYYLSDPAAYVTAARARV